MAVTFLVLRRGHGLLQLTVELHLDRLGRLVVDLVIDAHGVITALEHELLVKTTPLLSVQVIGTTT